MNKLQIAGLGLIIAAAFGAGVLAQQPPAATTAAPARGPAPKAAPPPVTGTIGPIPASLGPVRMTGVGINVTDLAAQKAWYETVLGMHQVGQYPASGTPYEYIMSMQTTRTGDAPVLAIIRGARQPGSTSYGRIIFTVPNADALAEHMRTHGVPTRRVAAGAYFLTDPEGNNVEIFTPQPPAPARAG